MSEQMALLRQCLAETPSIATWKRLLSLLEAWPEDELRGMAMEYAEAHLNASWDDRLRPKYATWASEYFGHRFARQPRTKLESLLDAEIVYCPPGSFLRGSEEDDDKYYSDEWPRTPITITRGMWVGVTPVTQQEWNHLFGSNHSEFPNPAHPVERVNWVQAAAFCNALSERDGLEPAFLIEAESQDVPPQDEHYEAEVLFKGLDVEGWRFPSEAEWEYLCRAGADNQWYAEELDEIAWHYHNSNYTSHPVREKAPNAWGLHDILGNICEWCLDTGDQYDYPSTYTMEELTDYLYSHKDSEHRIFRGGSWDSIPKQTRAAFRDHRHQNERLGRQGFRLVRTDTSEIAALKR